MRKVTKRIFMGLSITLASVAVAIACCSCASNVAISGREESREVVTNSYASVRYDGCFWKNDLWEDDWHDKKDRRRTLKSVRVKIYPWQSVVAVGTLGLWVPVYLEWEVNGDRK